MAEGQELGLRARYTYTMEDGTKIKLTLDKTLGDVANTGLTPTTIADNALNKPLKFKPRIVYCQRITATGRIVRKQIVCNKGSSLYESATQASVTIDGETYQTTGRRGEQISY